MLNCRKFLIVYRSQGNLGIYSDTRNLSTNSIVSSIYTLTIYILYIMNIKKTIEQLLCRHEDNFIRCLEYPNFRATYRECKKCGHKRFSKKTQNIIKNISK